MYAQALSDVLFQRAAGTKLNGLHDLSRAAPLLGHDKPSLPALPRGELVQEGADAPDTQAQRAMLRERA